jgi:hypothetical protein
MRNVVLTIAAVALAANGASAKPGSDDGPGNGNDNNRSEKSSRPAAVSAKPNNPAANKSSKPSKAADLRADEGPPAKREAYKAAPAKFDRGTPAAKDRDVIVNRTKDGRQFHNERGWSPRITTVEYHSGLINGCPPGLAKKHNGCVPPGLAKEQHRYFGYPYYQPSWWGFPRLSNGRYYYEDGFLLRLGDGGRISSYIPLLGGALSIGNRWPAYYEPVPLSPYYVDYYGLGPQGGYRYADQVIYRVDPETAAITSVAALLTGDEFAVGQRVPAGYDAYNVPYDYRESYYDRPGANYRYSDGYVYEVDPETMLVVSAIQLLT